MNPILPHPDPVLRHYADIDAQIVTLARQIRILSTLAWPLELQTTFLESWRRGNPQLPKLKHPALQHTKTIKDFDKLSAQVKGEDAVAVYLRETIQSYKSAALLLENLGKPKMTECSIALYGRPQDLLPGSDRSSMHAARHFITIADKFWKDRVQEDANYCLTAESIQRDLQAAINRVFTEHKVEVVLDPKMASKAAAGAKRIRLRQYTSFGPYDLAQLLQHEGLVHTLTAINGNEQPYLKSLGAGAPRTTSAQEGLATFAELVTGAMDIGRLKRIALRIIAVDMGLNGADFIEVFRFFIESGQNEIESFNSAARVFRGGRTSGSVVFTKDTVYLSGLLSCHTFLRWAMHETNLKHSRNLFCGRLAFEDTLRLETFFESGFIRDPKYLPDWLRNEQSLAAYLAFSLFADNIPVEDAGRAFLGSSQKTTHIRRKAAK